MENLDRERFLSILNKLAEVFPKVITETVADLYWDALKDKKIEAVARAARWLLREHKTMYPTPFEFRDACRESFVPTPESHQLSESTITPKERQWNRMILDLTVKAIDEKKRVEPDDIIKHAESVGFDRDFIGIQMAHYYRALKQMERDEARNGITPEELSLHTGAGRKTE